MARSRETLVMMGWGAVVEALLLLTNQWEKKTPRTPRDRACPVVCEKSRAAVIVMDIRTGNGGFGMKMTKKKGGGAARGWKKAKPQSR